MNQSLTYGERFPGAEKLPGFFVPEHSEGNRLVKASKCSTHFKPVESPGTLATLWRRKWANEYRITHRVQAPIENPPEQEGDRVTEELSMRGARKLGESCEYVSMKEGGYRTFLTLTFDREARARMLDHHAEGAFTEIEGFKNGLWQVGHIRDDGFYRILKGNSIQSELKRFFDALNKVYQRGFMVNYQRGWKQQRAAGDYYPVTFARAKIAGHDTGPYTPIRYQKDGSYRKLKQRINYENLPYCWVAENPINEQGRRNPHVHILLAWEVDYSVFPQWAARIERLWGQGFAHLEKLKSRGRHSAGAYLAKAAQYLAKAAGATDQGPIRGNRYGISQRARAPEWEPVTYWAWHIMGALIERARMLHARKLRPAKQARKKAQISYEQSKGKAKRRAFAILQKARESIEDAKNGFHFTRCAVVVQGMEKLNKFLSWAGRLGWVGLKKPPSLYFAELQKRIEKQKREYEAWKNATSPPEWFKSLLTMKPGETRQLWSY